VTRPANDSVVTDATASGGDRHELPAGLAPHRLRRRVVPVLVSLTALVLVALVAPGLDEVRERMGGASLGWLALAILLEGGSCASYVLMFRPIFCPTMSWRTVRRIGLSELAVISIMPASGASGLALGAWILHREGMASDLIARRSVAFFLIKCSVNFAAVVVTGTLMAVGAFGGSWSLWLTAFPAVGSVALIAAVVLVPRFGPGADPPAGAGRIHRAVISTRRALIGGTAEAETVVRSGNVTVIAGAIGYWAFDVVMLWATFRAFGAAPAVPILLMGYLVGQLGGLVPLPGGIGSVDGGLVGALVLYGAPLTASAAAVLAFRLILFWLPLVMGTPALVSLWRELRREPRPASG